MLGLGATEALSLMVRVANYQGMTLDRTPQRATHAFAMADLAM